MGIMVPVLVIPIGFIVHIFIAWLNKQKMKCNKKTDAYEQLEAMYEDIRLRKIAKKRLGSEKMDNLYESHHE